MLIFESLEAFQYDINKAISSYARISMEDARDFASSLTVSDYIALANAFEDDDEDRVTEIFDKNLLDRVSENFVYFENNNIQNAYIMESRFVKFLENASVSDILNANIFSNVKPNDIILFSLSTPKSIREALKEYKNQPPSINRDKFIMKRILEAILSSQVRSDIARVAGTSSSNIKNPSIADPKTHKSSAIVSADPKSGTIAAKDDKGNISIMNAKDPNVKKAIAFESENMERVIVEMNLHVSDHDFNVKIVKNGDYILSANLDGLEDLSEDISEKVFSRISEVIKPVIEKIFAKSGKISGDLSILNIAEKFADVCEDCEIEKNEDNFVLKRASDSLTESVIRRLAGI